MKVEAARALIQGRFVGELKDNMELCELSQQHLASEMGITQQAVSAWTRGQALPSLAAALAMANTLGITLNRLLTGED